ncbi:putative protein kinase [Methanosarcina siciliae T4/M]|uniref:Aminoglycoside phosphotransferase domain-containing protein n=1 Tax=Methanosarcina siciliae T4/M TaxID=1434120 RepID=A0A0E3P6C5_9EURY|nr:phosphotransferase enzyme family protein [Methanosarcina siciliae]AKB29305.1 putative protein kinase [Methanosarcina siciliae T4/M]
MLKLKYLFFNKSLAVEGIRKWKTEINNAEELLPYFRISSNAIYPFRNNDNVCFLRLAPVEEKMKDNEYGEIEFIQYLREHNFPALKPLPSLNDELIEIIKTEWGMYFASVFERVEGVPIEDTDLNDNIIFVYGKTLGTFHRLASDFRPSVKKWTYEDVLEWIEKELGLYGAQTAAMNEYIEVKNLLETLPKNQKNFGLVHYDFEPDNVFYDVKTETCNVIDFEDGVYHWFALDIEQVFDSLAEFMDEERVAVARKIFLNGYCTEFEISSNMLALLPVFRRFIDLYSYTRIIHSTSEILDNEPDWLNKIKEKLNWKKDSILARMKKRQDYISM